MRTLSYSADNIRWSVKKIPFVYIKFNSELKFLSNVPGRFMDCQNFELSGSFVAHCDEKLRGHNFVPLPRLVVKQLCQLCYVKQTLCVPNAAITQMRNTQC